MKPVLEMSNLTVSYRGKKALEEVSLTVPSSQLIGIIGPNGAGKSTFIKAVMGLLPFERGNVKVMGQPVNRARRRIAYVPQRNLIDFDFPVLVEDVVMMGRYPHMPWWGFAGARDRRLVEKALELVNLLKLRKRQIGQLSGGQQQRVFIARALAQEAEIFFLDEPFAGIDMTSEDTIVDLLKSLRDDGKSIFVVHHDLNKAERYFDNLILLNRRLIAFGKKEEVFQLQNLRGAYDDRVTRVCGSDDLLVVNA